MATSFHSAGETSEALEVEVLNATTVNAGASGTAGTVNVYPTTASKGKLAVAVTDQTGNTTVSLTIDAMAAARTIHLPDPGKTSYLMQSTAQITCAEADVLDGATAGTQVASKAVVADTNINIGVVKATALHIGTSGSETQVTATAAQLNATAVTTAGTLQASKAVIVGTSKQVNEWFITATSASTNGSTSVEPMVCSSTLTGIGGVGGRARFQLDTNVALGAWANALKAYTKFGATGSVSGLGSSFCAEMDLSAGTSAGTYAPIEIELNVPTGASTGTGTSFMYMSANGADASTFNANGFLFTLAGITSGTDDLFEAESKTGIAKTHTLRINIGGTAYFIPLHTAKACGGS